MKTEMGVRLRGGRNDRELEREDNATVLDAWHRDDLTTCKELTIKEEGRPPLGRGPMGLVIYPWPPSDEDD
jgi:hypothetical protein